MKRSSALGAAVGYAIGLVIVVAIAVAVFGFWLAGMAQFSTPQLIIEPKEISYAQDQMDCAALLGDPGDPVQHRREGHPPLAY